MPKWTKEQQSAIDLKGTNIIVSAGAGSGKTAVLTARVGRILSEGTHIDELLILTFTKAAAGEMKERIRKFIKSNPELRKELDLIDSAYITTFDSFALSVVYPLCFFNFSAMHRAPTRSWKQILPGQLLFCATHVYNKI